MQVSKRPTISVTPKTTTKTKQITSGLPCGKRSVKNFQTFMKILKSNPGGINILLARALLNDDLLDVFDGHPSANECVFSYPNSDWYSVYLVDEDGNKVWDPEAGYSKFYFKIFISPDGTDANIIEETMTNETPKELLDSNGNEIQNCKIGASKTCVNPVSRSEVKTTISKPKTKVAEVPLVSPSLRAELEPLSVGARAESSAPAGPKGKITRDYFEQLKSKELIVNWMIQNMSRSDLVKCLEKGAVNVDDLKATEELVEEEPALTEEIVNIAEQIPESQFKSMLKKVAKSSITAEINKLSSLDDKKNAIIKLCVRNGNPNNYSVKTNKRGQLKIYDSDGEPFDDNDIDTILQECAELEFKRLSAFGKKKLKKGSQQLKFKASAKKCKGSKNYRKCMSKTLKKK